MPKIITTAMRAHLDEETTTASPTSSGMQSADFGGAQAELSFVVYPDQRAGPGVVSRRGHRGDRAVSNNLELAQVAAAQNQKEVTINDQAGQLDAGLSDKVDVALTGTTSPLALSPAQALRCMVLKLTGTHPGGAYEVHCPTNKKIYVVWNSTAGDVTFKTVAGTGIAVNAGAVLILYCDGTNVIQLAGLVATIDDIGDVVITAAASGQMLRFNGSSWVNEDSPYDVGMFIPGTHGGHLLLASIAAYVGLDHERDIDWVSNATGDFLEPFAAGEVDAFLGFPPEPQELRARNIGRVISTPPWTGHGRSISAASSSATVISCALIRSRPSATCGRSLRPPTSVPPSRR